MLERWETREVAVFLTWENSFKTLLAFYPIKYFYVSSLGLKGLLKKERNFRNLQNAKASNFKYLFLTFPTIFNFSTTQKIEIKRSNFPSPIKLTSN